MTETTKPETPAFPHGSQEPSDDKAATRRDEWLAKLASNPRFVLIEPSGKGYVIGAAQRPKD